FRPLSSRITSSSRPRTSTTCIRTTRCSEARLGQPADATAASPKLDQRAAARAADLVRVGARTHQVVAGDARVLPCNALGPRAIAFLDRLDDRTVMLERDRADALLDGLLPFAEHQRPGRGERESRDRLEAAHQHRAA